MCVIKVSDMNTLVDSKKCIILYDYETSLTCTLHITLTVTNTYITIHPLCSFYITKLFKATLSVLNNIEQEDLNFPIKQPTTKQLQRVQANLLATF